MASIARSLRPAAARFIQTSRGSAHASRLAAFPLRAFSASAAVQVKKYSKDHEWIELAPDNKTGTIGISEYAAHALGDVVYVELPTTPLEAAKGDAIGAVESVKSASDINSPITCTITAVNEALEEKPSAINQGAEDSGAGGGWVAKVEVDEAAIKDLDDLMDAGQYKAFTEEE